MHQHVPSTSKALSLHAIGQLPYLDIISPSHPFTIAHNLPLVLTRHLVMFLHAFCLLCALPTHPLIFYHVIYLTCALPCHLPRVLSSFIYHVFSPLTCLPRVLLHHLPHQLPCASSNTSTFL